MAQKRAITIVTGDRCLCVKENMHTPFYYNKAWVAKKDTVVSTR